VDEGNLIRLRVIKMAIEADIQTALRSDQPLGQLRSIIVGLLDAGQTPESVLAILERCRQQLRSEGREADEDTLMDAMDFLTGWCAPHMKLPVDKGG
jgi:hypothetical protein